MEMQEDSLWRLYPVHDMDTVVTNRLLYCDLYLGQYKETLKQTMLGQESIFENQVSLSVCVFNRCFISVFLVSYIMLVSSDLRASSSVSKAEGSDDGNGGNQQLVHSASTFIPKCRGL